MKAHFRILILLTILFGLGIIADNANAADQLELLWNHDPTQGNGTTEYIIYTAAVGTPIDQGKTQSAMPILGATSHSAIVPYPNLPTEFAVQATNPGIGESGPISATITLKPGLGTPSGLTFRITPAEGP